MIFVATQNGRTKKFSSKKYYNSKCFFGKTKFFFTCSKINYLQFHDTCGYTKW
jgi:hypothetical protein